ncbi:HD domain-containing protein [Aminipila butyrica]|uniref:HD domain-containing protein n=1 Tax=Aminipila butyrica TaxID=433296 RepID=A0A858BRF6_9FIRM|nr:HD domain-containing protein [Aminipila butyrica]QIB67902.1 HD domain-containing protein [Aminipila butyrica]
MHILLQLQSALLKEIDKYEKLVPERDQPIDWERVHISSCAKLGYLMAEERGIDPSLAACACAVHDYGRIITGKQAGHAEAGYLPVQDFLKRTGLFTAEEIKLLSIAVKNHSNKSDVGGPIEEIVKDADVLDFHQYGYEMPRAEQQARLDRLLKK